MTEKGDEVDLYDRVPLTSAGEIVDGERSIATNDDDFYHHLEVTTSEQTPASRLGDDTIATVDDVVGGVAGTTNKASVRSCVVNLLNTIAGAGMLGLPAAYAGSGYVGGTIALILAAFLSSNGLRLLSLSAETVRRRQARDAALGTRAAPAPASFYSVASAALPQFTVLIDLAVAVKCFGVATGYFVTVGDCMVDVMRFALMVNNDDDRLGGSALLISRRFWVFAAFVLVLPISFFRTLDALKTTSVFSLFLIYGLALGIVFYAEGFFDPCAADDVGESPAVVATNLTTAASALFASRSNDDPALNHQCRGPQHALTDVVDALRNLPIFVFSFTCHQNIFAVFNEISNRTQSRMNVVITVSVVTALALYLVVAVEGYRTFGDRVKGDILLNYPQTVEVSVMRVFIAFMVVLSYPLQLDPSRRCITSLVHSVQSSLERRGWRARRGDRSSSNSSSSVLCGKIIGRRGEDEALDFDFEDSDVRDMLTTDDRDGVNEKSGDGPIDSNVSVASSNNGSFFTIEVDDDAGLMDDAYRDFLFRTITCAFLICSFLIALVVTDLGVVLGVIGATGSTTVSYILPGAVYVKVHQQENGRRRIVGSKLWLALAYAQLVLGLIIAPTALYFVLLYHASA